MKKYVNLILFLVLLDQFTKYLVRKNLILGQTVFVNSFFNISYITNTGIAFGMFKNANLFFAVFTVVFLVMFAVYFYKNKERLSIPLKTAFMLLIAGASGNLIDRLTNGHVIDFLEFHIKNHYWPSFNVADSCISVGGVILFLSLVIFDKKEEN
jgi:signal peptidase II